MDAKRRIRKKKEENLEERFDQLRDKAKLAAARIEVRVLRGDVIDALDHFFIHE